MDTVELGLDELGHIIATALRHVGVTVAESRCIADALVDAEACGAGSHGVLRVPGYLAAYRAGRYASSDDETVLTSTGGVTVLDGGGRLGYLPTSQAVRRAVDLGRRCGIAAVGVRNIGEFGRAGFYARSIARAGLLGVVCQNVPPNVLAPGQHHATHGNNPIAFATPGDGGCVHDAAFSPRSGGELLRRRLLDLALLDEWGYTDELGHPTTDPHRAVPTSAPIVGGVKGFGLVLLVEMLAGLLTGSSTGPALDRNSPTKGAFVIAIEPSAFGVDIEAPVAEMADRVRSSGGPWPGDRSRTARTAAERRGTVHVPRPIDDELRAALSDLSPKRGA